MAFKVTVLLNLTSGRLVMMVIQKVVTGVLVTAR